MNERFNAVLARIDACNAGDPSRQLVNGISQPAELAHATRVSEWIRRLLPDPSEALLIAARGHHIERWRIPRERYETGRTGYLRWREELKRFHADRVGTLMAACGYDADAVARVRSLILRKDLREDAEAQALEDALCLDFLEHQFADLAAKTEGEKMVEIVRKTWRKMSEAARAKALALPLAAAERALLDRALRP